MTEALYSFDESAMGAGQAAFNSATANVMKELEELDRDLRKNLTWWEDRGRFQYDGHKTEWDNAAVRMSEVLVQGETALGEITANYLRAEGRNQQLWG